MDLRDIQNLVFEEYKRNGYLHKWNSIQDEEIADIAELALIGTEISEAIEDIRGNRSKIELASELSDIIIRVLNFSNRKGIDVEKAILAKNRVNLNREFLHGRII